MTDKTLPVAAVYVTSAYRYKIRARYTDLVGQQWDDNAVAPDCEQQN